MIVRVILPAARLAAMLAVLWGCVAILVTAGLPWSLLIVAPAAALILYAAWHQARR